MLQVHSLTTETTLTPGEEVITPLFEKAGVRIERIDSYGQGSPEGFWYDQPHDEWVLLMQGRAVLEAVDQRPLTLKPGDFLVIPAHVRHRVAQTTENAIWIAVHVNQAPAPLQT